MSNVQVKITNNNISINRSNLTKIIVQGNQGFNGIHISNGNPGFMSGYTGIVINGNHINCNDPFYSNGIFIDNIIVNDLNITGNNIGGFTQNGIKITAIGGNVGIISNNNIYRQEGKTIDSFICGGGVTTYAVVVDNFFSHDTIDDINWQDSVKNRGAYWTVERNKNQIEEIEINAANGNYFATNANVNISSNDLLQLTSVVPVVQASSTPVAPASGTVEDDVRVSLLIRRNIGDSYPELFPIFDDTSTIDTYDVGFNGATAPLFIPTFMELPTPEMAFIRSVLDNAFGLVHSEAGGVIYVDRIGTTMSIPFRITSTESGNDFTQDFGFPFIRSYNWLDPNASEVASHLIQFIKGFVNVDGAPTLYVKITGSNRGFNGTFPIIEIKDSGKLRLDFDSNIDSAPTPIPPEPDPSNVAWAVSLLDLIGSHRMLKEGSLTLSTTSGTIGDISVFLNKQTLVATASNINSDTTINFTGIPNNYVNTSGSNIKAIINNLSGTTRLKMTLRYKW